MQKKKKVKYSGLHHRICHAKLSAENMKTVPGPTRVAAIKSAFELHMPNSIHEIILEVTNPEETKHFCFGEEVEGAGQNTFGCIFGAPHPGWGLEVEG